MRPLVFLALPLLIAIARGDGAAPRARAHEHRAAAATAAPAPAPVFDVPVPLEDALLAAGPLEEEEDAPAFLDWDAPLHGRITDVFGTRDDGSAHDAIDIAAGVGSEVKAPADLRISYVGYRKKAGRFILADTADGSYELTFAHLSHVDVVDGQRVARGATLGLTGITGHVTGPHLHFRIERIDDEGARTAVDPLTIISADLIRSGAAADDDDGDDALLAEGGARDGDVDEAIDSGGGADDVVPRGDTEADLGARPVFVDDLGAAGSVPVVEDDLGAAGSVPVVEDDLGAAAAEEAASSSAR